jgi:deoxyribose-phosphate aldolase
MKLNNFIDHTLLAATATASDIINLCKEAKTYSFYAVCVNSSYVKLAHSELKDSTPKVCSVIGFPLGTMSTTAKVEETKRALLDGADEIDMVIHIGMLKSQNFEYVQKDIEAVKSVMHNKVLKVILETCYLNEVEIIKASKLAIQSGADFIKTSTGFGTGGATIQIVKLMQNAAKHSNTKIKASGGIRDYETAKKYIDLGVHRLGLSAGVTIMNHGKSNDNY